MTGQQTPAYLRDTRAVPLFVSDARVDRALGYKYSRRAISDEQVRSAKLVALIAGIRARESELGSRDLAAVEFPLEVDRIARLTRLQPSQVRQSLLHLREAGALYEVQASGGTWYRLAAEVLAPSPAAEALDWSGILAALEGEAAALLVARALADLLSAPYDSWTPVRLSVLADQTGYGSITVRKGKDVLVTRGLLEEDAQQGQTSQYRFSLVARGQAVGTTALAAAPSSIQAPADHATSSAPSSTFWPSALPTPLSPVVPQSAGGGVPVRIAGLSLRLPEGTSLRVEVDSRGQQTVHVGEHIVIGPL